MASSAEYGPTVASVGPERPGEFMPRDLAPLLFDDDEREAAEAARRSVVAPRPRSRPRHGPRPATSTTPGAIRC